MQFSYVFILIIFSLQIVVKSQILAGGRGLGTLKSGLKGGVHIVKAEEAEGIASKCVHSEYIDSLCIAGLLHKNMYICISFIPRIPEITYAFFLLVCMIVASVFCHYSLSSFVYDHLFWHSYAHEEKHFLNF